MGLLERQLSFLQVELKYDIVADNEGRRFVLELISIFTLINLTYSSYYYYYSWSNGNRRRTYRRQ